MRTRTTTGPWTGHALRAAREVAGLTQYALAARVREQPECGKVSANTVRANEGTSGPARPPNATLLAAYARVLGVTMDRLCSEPPEVPR